MPLLDHFHRPLFPARPWESFHSTWAVTLMEQLNRTLPERYFAAVQVHLGSRVEADVAEFQERPAEEPTNGPPGGVAVATYAPPAAALTIPAVFPDDIEVRVIDMQGDATVVGVIELVSPGNKDRPETRQLFAAKCAAYLQRGVGLIIVDVVTSRQANLHDELLRLLHWPGPSGLSDDTVLYAAAYRPQRRDESNQIAVWPAPLVVGSPLPVLPLGLRGAGCVPIDLETTYSEARQRSRL